MSFQRSIPILYSDNVVRSLTYYMEVLNFDHKWDWGNPPTFGGVSKDGVELFFCEKEQGNPGTWISIMLDDVDEYYETIKAKGAIIASPPESMPWGIREMHVQDPDGHTIRFGHNISHKLPSSGFPDNIRIVERKPDIEEYKALIAAVGWQQSQANADPAKILAAPLFAVVAEDSETNTAIGCALLLGDEASFYYVKDVMVHPKWQCKQIGTAMMKALTHWLQEHAPQNALVGLYTGGYLAPFYNQFGFRHAYGMSMRVQKPEQ